MRHSRLCLAVLSLAALTAGRFAPAADPPAPAKNPADARPAGLDAQDYAKAKALMDKGAAFLLSKRNANGGWTTATGAAEPAITAMVLKALVQHPDFGASHAAVAKGFEVLLSHRRDDGGIYGPREGSSSYTSAVALMALAAAKDPRNAGQVRDLVAYLKSLQIVPGSESSDGKKMEEDDPRVGGVSYGRGPMRPDLSNVGMWAEALHEAGVPKDDPALQRAVAFVSRLQNHSETNKMAWAQEGTNDGGFIYTFPSKEAGKGRGPSAPAGRSYGSMTYTGFKSMLYAGVARDDSRVRAAYQWIRRYWRLDANPNMPQTQSRSGLFYYYHVFAKALRAWGEPVITDAKGEKHNWRHELIDALAKQVKEDGSWVNDSDRWWEGDAVLTTSYALMALEEAIGR